MEWVLVLLCCYIRCFVASFMTSNLTIYNRWGSQNTTSYCWYLDSSDLGLRWVIRDEVPMRHFYPFLSSLNSFTSIFFVFYFLRDRLGVFQLLSNISCRSFGSEDLLLELIRCISSVVLWRSCSKQFCLLSSWDVNSISRVGFGSCRILYGGH